MTAVAERTAAAPSYLRHDKPLWRRLLFRTDTALLVVLIAVILWATVSVPFFAQPFTYSTVLLAMAPILLMVENQRSGMLWELLRSSRPVIEGLRRAGFSGGWLDHDQASGT